MVLGRLSWIQPTEDHGLDHFESRTGMKTWLFKPGNSVSDSSMTQIFDIGIQKTNFPWADPVPSFRIRGKDTQLLDFKVFTVGIHLDTLTFGHKPVKDPKQDHHTLVWVVPGIEDQRLKRILDIAFRGRYVVNNMVQEDGYT